MVQAKLEFDELSAQDRIDYLKAIENRVIERDVWQTNLEEAEERGLEQGRSEATEKGILRALQRGKLTIEEIAEDFNVPLEQALQLKKRIEN